MPEGTQTMTVGLTRRMVRSMTIRKCRSIFSAMEVRDDPVLHGAHREDPSGVRPSIRLASSLMPRMLPVA